MFFNNPEQIERLIKNTGFSIFSFPQDFDYLPFIPKHVLPITATTPLIPIESIREIEPIIHIKQDSPITIVVYPAENLSESAMNACLKILETPRQNIHFAFFTHHPQKLLPTIHSRAHHYSLRQSISLEAPPQANPKQLELAKQLIAATPTGLPTIINQITKDKTNSRQKTLEIIDISIQLLYKSYFKTGDKKWLLKLPRFMSAHQAIAANGHIKLQLAAALL